MLQRKVDILDDLADEFQVVVNCAGLGARWICQDKSVLPLRGQVGNDQLNELCKSVFAGPASVSPLGEDCHVC